MYANMALDFGIGLVPVIGDIADAFFKCNTRNNILLERYLREKGQKHPVAPPPPKQKQSTLSRWFGSEPDHLPRHHPVEAHPAAASSTTPATDSVNPPASAAASKLPSPDRSASAIRADSANGAVSDPDRQV